MSGPVASHVTPLDLHLHTRYSDGDDDPAEVARRCLAAGVRVAAVTDHNTLAGSAAFAEALRGTTTTVVPGCEITADWRGEEVHCLAYFADPGDPVFTQRLRRAHDAEVWWWREWVERVQGIGVPLTWDEVTRRLGGDRVAYVGDYLALLVQAAGEDPRFARYAPAAYEGLAADWCRPGKPLHVEQCWRPGILEVLSWVAEAGGVAVLAHPARIPHAWDSAAYKPLREAGLAGLEVWTSWHTPAESDSFAKLCADLGLAATAGSDYHGARVKSWVPGPGLLPALPPDPMAVLDALHHRRPAPAPAKVGP